MRRNRIWLLMIFLGWLGLACLAAPELIPAPVVTSPPGETSGLLVGKVTVGPLTPVERPHGPGVTPSPIPPEVYTSRSINIYQADGITLVKNVPFKGDGTYRVALPPGTYVVALADKPFGFSKDLPKTITILAGETVVLNIDIDTGIR